MKKTVTIPLQKLHPVENKLVTEFRDVFLDCTFYSYNLEAHQVLNVQNIETMMDCIKIGETTQVLQFLQQLEEQSHKLHYALQELETNIQVCQTFEID